MKYARIKDNTIKQEETVGRHRGRPLRYNNLKMTSNTTEEMYINSDEDWRIVDIPTPTDTQRLGNKIIEPTKVTYELIDLSVPELEGKLGQRLIQMAQSVDQHILSGGGTGFVSSTALPMVYDKAKNSKPASLSIVNWVNALWAEYYSRQDQLIAQSIQWDESLLDFSSFGPIPASIRDAINE